MPKENTNRKIYKFKNQNKVVENHDTAAWANISDIIQDSNVNIPSETQVINAKEYVDNNQK